MARCACYSRAASRVADKLLPRVWQPVSGLRMGGNNGACLFFILFVIAYSCEKKTDFPGLRPLTWEHRTSSYQSSGPGVSRLISLFSLFPQLEAYMMANITILVDYNFEALSREYSEADHAGICLHVVSVRHILTYPVPLSTICVWTERLFSKLNSVVYNMRVERKSTRHVRVNMEQILCKNWFTATSVKTHQNSLQLEESWWNACNFSVHATFSLQIWPLCSSVCLQLCFKHLEGLATFPPHLECPATPKSSENDMFDLASDAAVGRAAPSHDLRCLRSLS